MANKLIITIATFFFSCHSILANKYGLVSTFYFDSKYVASRNITVYLPKGYSKNKHLKYDVLYMHDGQNLFDKKTAFGGVEWRVDEILDSLLQAKKIRPCIVVGIWNSERRFEEYLPKRPISYGGDTLMKLIHQRKADFEALSDDYLKFIVTELKPFIDQHYRTNPSRTHTHIAGSSMGGLISLYAALEYPEIFGSAACVSTHWPIIHQAYNTVFTEAMMSFMNQRFNETPLRPILYFDYGTETLDKFYEPCQRMIDEFLLQHQYDFTLWTTRRFAGAAHNEASWSKRTPIILGFLLKKHKEPY